MVHHLRIVGVETVFYAIGEVLQPLVANLQILIAKISVFQHTERKAVAQLRNEQATGLSSEQLHDLQTS